LTQLNLGGTYFTAGLSKLADPGWIAGTAFWDTLRNPFFSQLDYLWLTPHEGILRGISYAVLVCEIAVPFLLIFKWSRPWALLGLVIFHLGIDFTIKVGWFSWLATAYMFVFIDDLGLKRKKEYAGDYQIQTRSRLVNCFLYFHLVAFVLAQLSFVSISLKKLDLRLDYLSKIPVLREYVRYVARIHYFNVWPSTFFLRPVRSLYYEATDSSGKLLPFPPYNEKGEFVPGIRFWKEARDGLLLFRIANRGLTEKQWDIFLVHLVERHKKIYKGQCPNELKVFRIYSNPEVFEGSLKKLRVPKTLWLRAGIQCGSGPPKIEVLFTEEGKRFVRG